MTICFLFFFESQNRDAVAELRENGFETSSGSDSELDGNDGEIASTGSGDTEGKRSELESVELDSNFIFINSIQAPKKSYIRLATKIPQETKGIGRIRISKHRRRWDRIVNLIVNMPEILRNH